MKKQSMRESKVFTNVTLQCGGGSMTNGLNLGRSNTSSSGKRDSTEGVTREG